MSGKFALIIGNTEYTDPGLAQLTAPGKDAEDFARVLKDQDLCAFDDVNVLLNQPSYVIGEVIDTFFYQKKPDDLLIVYFSGHGVRDEFGALYLAVKNTNRARLRATAIRSDYIREAMDQSRSKRQVLILDCCNSGAFEQGTKAATGVSIGTATAFEAGYGRIILTASDSTQFAWEGDKVIGETDNSLFTHYLVEGLEGEADLDGDGHITVDELYDYAYEKVKLATPKQTPSKFSSKQQGEIILRQITRLEDIKPISLPDELLEATEDSRTFVREGAVQQLEKLLKGKNLGLARSAREALERMEKEDDSHRVSQAATQVLEAIRKAEQVALQKAEEERLAAEKAEADRLAQQKAEEEHLAHERREAEKKAKGEAERKAKREARRLATLKAEEERLAREKAEEERLAALNAEEERIAREEAEHIAIQKTEQERLAHEKAEAERKAREESERLARAKAKREATELAAREAAEKTAERESALLKTEQKAARRKAKAEPTVREPTNFLSAPKVKEKIPARDTAEGRALLIKTRLSELFAYLKEVWEKIIEYLETVPDNKSRIYALSSLALVIIGGFWFYQQLNTSDLYFSGTSAGGISIYFYDGEIADIPQGIGEGRNWSPVVGAFGKLYFTSNRDGKAEIYELKRDGNVERKTHTPDPWESWSPAFGAFGRLFFTSNRDGRAEIYELKSDGNVERKTHTPDPWESWSPAVDAFGRLYFTSNRDGKAEIYELKRDGSVERKTQTPDPWESWSPAVAAFGRLFFTSDRNGEVEIFELMSNSNVQQFTYTPGLAESWSPVVRGQNIYFTSNREGDNRVYVLTPQANALVPFESWTTRTIESLPFSDP